MPVRRDRDHQPPSELDEEPVHRYGDNAFSLYGLPTPKPGNVTGILGPNGIGKSTAVHALAGEMVPNLGDYESEGDWERVLDRFRGTGLQNYLQSLKEGDVTVARKPQYVDQIPNQFDGNTRELLERTDERGALDSLIDRLNIRPVMDQPIDSISGGELQRVAIAACLARDADFYFLDEITPYLDIGQRMIVARLIRELADDDAAERSMLVVEHDLAILDLLADTLHVAYGEPGAYGVVTDPKSVRNGINEYLKGYLDNENMRIRPSAITFEEHAPRVSSRSETLIEYPELSKSYGDGEFELHVEGGEINRSEGARRRRPERDREVDACEAVRGLVGTGRGELDFALDIAYKPQYIDIDQPMRVDVFLSSITDDFGSSYWNTEIAQPLQLDRVMEQNLSTCRAGSASASPSRRVSPKTPICTFSTSPLRTSTWNSGCARRRRSAGTENHDATVMVIDHDIYMIDLLADRLMVFDGEPAERGHATPPQEMRDGMNEFLADLDITFRRDDRRDATSGRAVPGSTSRARSSTAHRSATASTTTRGSRSVELLRLYNVRGESRGFGRGRRPR